MNAASTGKFAALLQKNDPALLEAWMKVQTEAQGGNNRMDAAEMREQSRNLLAEMRTAATKGSVENFDDAAWDEVRHSLQNVSASRARQGFSPSETATFVFSLKLPVFEALRKEAGDDGMRLGAELWEATQLLDKLGLYTTEAYQRTRNDIIVRQQAEMMELSTPVVQLWDGILGLPLVGTLDSSRTQVVMESLLQRIVDTGSEIAIIDITGVPTVDTLVAQHLMKTIAATRLMGADCIISGIRPQIAQTIVHLGVDLGEVTTKATLADALAVALKRLKKNAMPTA
jgi:rsbT co-antagonist protein RsbR